MTSLQGRVILVTGASAGIGFATARLLAERGATVIGCARNIQTLQELGEKSAKGRGQLFPMKADLSKEEDIVQLFKEIGKKFGKLDVLINNAGMAGKATLLEGDSQDYRNIFDLNVLGLTLATREAVKLMEAGGSGHIINLNSILGHAVPNGPTLHFYTGTKHMITALTEALRKTVQSKNIKVTSLSPGIVATEITQRAFGLTPAEAFASTATPYKVLDSEDVAEAIVYILSVPAHVNIDELTLTPQGQHAL
ncbi:Dehydrogenase/reductase SDR family member 11 [Hypsibius exemplaris]|uniref:Dehydrogenase/reductase SDR family member 11 n=1 Tax=Hypsibius exemplaris TaxID=2072580 RepID=A0A1W0WNN4_HYPEX|nr:Dehydrogenase/reductase SDR family member 11 [Hypsibius exemplaris]